MSDSIHIHINGGSVDIASRHAFDEESRGYEMMTYGRMLPTRPVLTQREKEEAAAIRAQRIANQ